MERGVTKSLGGSLVGRVNEVLGPLLSLRLMQSQFATTLTRLANIAQERDMAQLLYQKRLLDAVAAVEGDIVECGVGWGRSLLYWALLAREEGRGRRIWGFDSFQGFPEPTAEDAGLKQAKQGRWAVPIDETIRLLTTAGFTVQIGAPPAGHEPEASVTLVKGFLAESLPGYPDRPISLLHLDVDLYHSYHDGLRHLYPKIAPGGLVAFDEYEPAVHLKWPGAKKAIDEYLGLRAQAIRTDSRSGKCYLVKAESRGR